MNIIPRQNLIFGDLRVIDASNILSTPETLNMLVALNASGSSTLIGEDSNYRLIIKFPHKIKNIGKMIHLFFASDNGDDNISFTANVAPTGGVGTNTGPTFQIGFLTYFILAPFNFSDINYTHGLINSNTTRVFTFGPGIGITWQNASYVLNGFVNPNISLYHNPKIIGVPTEVDFDYYGFVVTPFIRHAPGSEILAFTSLFNCNLNLKFAKPFITIPDNYNRESPSEHEYNSALHYYNNL